MSIVSLAIISHFDQEDHLLYVRDFCKNHKTLDAQEGSSATTATTTTSNSSSSSSNNSSNSNSGSANTDDFLLEEELFDFLRIDPAQQSTTTTTTKNNPKTTLWNKHNNSSSIWNNCSIQNQFLLNTAISSMNLILNMQQNQRTNYEIQTMAFGIDGQDIRNAHVNGANDKSSSNVVANFHNGRNFMWVGSLGPCEDYLFYGYITRTNVKIVVGIEDMIHPENTQSQRDKEIQIRALLENIHALYVNQLMNPFTTKRSKISSPRFHNGVQDFVNTFNVAFQ